MTNYVSAEYGTFPFPAIRMGKTGEPAIQTAGGVKSSGTITFAANPTAADTITIDGIYVEFTASASDATTAGTVGDPLLVNIKASLALTLDEILAVCNAGTVPAAMQLATYTEDGATILTITYDEYELAGDTFTLAASSDTVSAATLEGAQLLPDDRSAFGPTEFALTQSVNQNFLLGDGDETQRKFIYATALSTGDAVVTPISLRGGTTITFANAGEYSELRFMNGEWVQTAGTATVA